MAYDPLTTAETTAGQYIRQALMRKVLGNFDDIEARVSGVEGVDANALIDHFDNTDHGISGTPSLDNNRWAEAVSSGTITLNTASHSVALAGTALNQRARIRSKLRHFPGLLPRCKFRLKVLAKAGINDLLVGLQDDRAIGAVPDDGIYLIATSASTWKFITVKDAAFTDGSTFTAPADDTWFEVEVRYIDGDSVECYFDGSLKSTFDTTNVPNSNSYPMYATVHATFLGSGTTVTVDRGEARNTVIADEA